MANNPCEQRPGFSQAWWERMRASARTIGEYKRLVAPAIGGRVDDLFVYEVIGKRIYLLPDWACVPQALCVCVLPEARSVFHSFEQKGENK